MRSRVDRLTVVRALANRLLLAAGERLASYIGFDRPHPDAHGMHVERNGFALVYRDSRLGAHTSRCVEQLHEHTERPVSDVPGPVTDGLFQGSPGTLPVGSPGTPRTTPRTEPPGPLIGLREAVDTGVITCTVEAAKMARKRGARTGFPAPAGSRPTPGPLGEKLYRAADLAAWESRRRR